MDKQTEKKAASKPEKEYRRPKLEKKGKIASLLGTSMSAPPPPLE